MDEDQAIERYNQGASATGSSAFPGIQWPDIALDAATLERLAEGLVASRIDLVSAAFGDSFDAEAAADHLEEAWRTDDLQARFAPEGVYIRMAYTIRFTLVDDDVVPPTIETATVRFGGEFCLSYTERHGVRPVVDFMSGEVRCPERGVVKTIDPFSLRIDPADALAWGLNGVADPR